MCLLNEFFKEITHAGDEAESTHLSERDTQFVKFVRQKGENSTYVPRKAPPIGDAATIGCCLCTMLDVRCTIQEIPALARELGEVCRLADLLPLTLRHHTDFAPCGQRMRAVHTLFPSAARAPSTGPSGVLSIGDA